MKKFLFAMASVGALAAAAPSVAQNVNSRGGMGISNQIAQLDTRLQAGISSGEITRQEARTLRMQLNQLSRLERQYSLNGLTQSERTDLRQRIRTLRQELRTADRGLYDSRENAADWAEYDANGSGYGAGAYSTRIAQLQTRFNAGIRSGEISANEASSLRVQLSQLATLERQYSRNGLTTQEQTDLQRRIADTRQQIRTADRGRYDSYENAGDWAEYDDEYNRDVYGQGGPYEEAQCDSRSGGGVIGGILNTVLGNNGQNDCGLRVGQRVTGNLGAVPYEYRNQYRDGNGVYYRSDGRSIYQVDARTDTVVRIYSISR
jgi:hypothetical protein